jgi:hypothetical protein
MYFGFLLLIVKASAPLATAPIKSVLNKFLMCYSFVLGVQNYGRRSGVEVKKAK